MFNYNLKEVRNKLGIAQGEMAYALKIQQSQYSRYENGTSKPSVEVLEKLVKQFNININYLLTGNGPMFITPELSRDTLQFKIPKNARVLLEVEE